MKRFVIYYIDNIYLSMGAKEVYACSEKEAVDKFLLAKENCQIISIAKGL